MTTILLEMADELYWGLCDAAKENDTDPRDILRALAQNYLRRMGYDTPDLLPDGAYEVCIVDAEVGHSGNDNPMLTLRLKVIRPPEYNGSTFLTHLMLKGAGIRYTQQAFKVLDLPGGHHDTDELLYLIARVEVGANVWKVQDGGDGRPRNCVKSWKEM